MSAITALTQAIEHMNKPAASVDYQALAAAITTALEPLLQRPQVMENGKLPLTTLEFSPKLDARRSPKLEAAIEWLKNNPDKLGLSNREIGRLIGVSHPTIAEARKELSVD